MAGIEPGLFAKTAVSELRIRSKPGLSGDSQKLEPLLQKGKLLSVIDGPVEASGYDWFLVRPRAYDESGHALPTGWVAAGKDGERWIKPYEFDCPSVPTSVDGMKGLASDYQLSCFAGVDITFTARLEQVGYPCSSHEPIEPSWFDHCASEYPLTLVALKSYHRFLGHVWAPGVDLSIAAPPAAPPEMWPTVEVTGQFDHPEASTCRKPSDGPDTPDNHLPALTVLTCRNIFVVTSMRKIEG